MLEEVLRRFYEAQESFIVVKEGEIRAEEFNSPLPLFVRVLLTNGKRRRFVNLGALSRVYAFCPELREFVKDFLDLSISLEDIYEKHCLLTEWEALSLCPEKALEGESRDYVEAMRKLRETVRARKCWKAKQMP